MKNFHVNRKGEPGVCRARAQNCPFGSFDGHFSSEQDARIGYENFVESVVDKNKTVKFDMLVSSIERNSFTGGIHFAKALAKDSGLPIYFLGDKRLGEDYWVRFVNKLPDGRFIDIEGVWTEEDLLKRWGNRGSDLLPTDLIPIEPDDLRRAGVQLPEFTNVNPSKSVKKIKEFIPNWGELISETDSGVDSFANRDSYSEYDSHIMSLKPSNSYASTEALKVLSAELNLSENEVHKLFTEKLSSVFRDSELTINLPDSETFVDVWRDGFKTQFDDIDDENQRSDGYLQMREDFEKDRWGDIHPTYACLSNESNQGYLNLNYGGVKCVLNKDILSDSKSFTFTIGDSLDSQIGSTPMRIDSNTIDYSTIGDNHAIKGFLTDDFSEQYVEIQLLKKITRKDISHVVVDMGDILEEEHKNFQNTGVKLTQLSRVYDSDGIQI